MVDTGMDAITHSIEAYVSNASSAVTDALALEAISQMSEYLILAQKNPENVEYRNQTLLGSLLGGLAFSNASLGDGRVKKGHPRACTESPARPLPCNQSPGSNHCGYRADV